MRKNNTGSSAKRRMKSRRDGGAANRLRLLTREERLRGKNQVLRYREEAEEPARRSAALSLRQLRWSRAFTYRKCECWSLRVEQCVAILGALLLGQDPFLDGWERTKAEVCQLSHCMSAKKRCDSKSQSTWYSARKYETRR